MFDVHFYSLPSHSMTCLIYAVQEKWGILSTEKYILLAHEFYFEDDFFLGWNIGSFAETEIYSVLNKCICMFAFYAF